MDYHFIVVFIQCCSLYSVISGSTITVGPHDTEAIAGGNVILHCTVQNLGGNTVVWRDFNRPTVIKYSENRTIVAPSEINPSRYKITGNDTEGTFNLEITGITELIDGFKTYECTVAGVSRKAQLQVYDNPPSPTCSVPRRDNAFVEGEDVDYECTFESILPKVEMNLTRNGNTLSSAIVEPDRTFLRSESSTRFIATSDYNGALLSCSVDHQILSMPYYCSLTLNVMYKPIVQITQFGMIADGNASFTCDAVSNPDAIQFKWSLCLGINTGKDCINLGDGILTVEQDNSDEFVEFKLFCSDAFRYVFKIGDTRLPVWLLRNESASEVPDGYRCVLDCSFSNLIGEGNDVYTIDNTICVMGNESTTATVPTMPMPCTSINHGLAGWVYFVIGYISGCVFSLVIFLLRSRMNKPSRAKTNSSVPPQHERGVDDTRERPNDGDEYANSSPPNRSTSAYMDLIGRPTGVPTEYMNVPNATAYMELTPKQS